MLLKLYGTKDIRSNSLKSMNYKTTNWISTITKNLLVKKSLTSILQLVVNNQKLIFQY